MGKYESNILKNANSRSTVRLSSSISDDYLAYVNKYKLLSDEEEQKYVTLAKDGDKDALDVLIKCNQKMITHIIAGFNPSHDEYMDLIQAGNLGIIYAVDHYDVEKNNKFSTFAYKCIRGTILNYIANNTSVLSVPGYAANNLRNIKFYLEEHPKATVKEISKALKISEAVIQNTMVLMQPPVFLDASAYREDFTDSGRNDKVKNELISDEAERKAFDKIAIEDIRECLLLLTENLKDNEKQVIIMRYGLDGTDFKTLQTIADIMGKSRERIRTIEASALRKMRKKALTSKNPRIRDLKDCL